MNLIDRPTCELLLALVLGSACLLAAHPARGADAPAAPASRPAAKASTKGADAKPREGSLGKGTSTGPLLTREQLRQCMVEQDRLKQESSDTLQTQRGLAKDRSEIDRLGVELKAEMAALDRTSQAAVDAFNEKAQAREKMIDAYQEATPNFNERVDKLDADKQLFAKGCAERRYREDDFDAIKAGK